MATGSRGLLLELLPPAWLPPAWLPPAWLPPAWLLSAACLLWPALRNGYPLVFADTGTYLSQAIEGYVGWDRPVFYSLFMLPLHLALTTWPVVVAQALLATILLRLLCRVLLPGAPAWLLPLLAAGLALGTALPWFVAQLMPDVFAGLLVLALALLVLAPDRLARAERLGLAGAAGFMMTVHLSHLLLALGLLAVLVPTRRRLGARGPLGRSGLRLLAAPLALAVLALVGMNLVAFGRASVSPFGSMFLLARVIYDGPGLAVLRRDCPGAGWRLCPYLDRLPADADAFLWRADSPVMLAGGHKLVAAEAGPIIAAAIRAAPAAALRGVAENTLRQLGRFATGDGLQPWPGTVAPRIERDFPGFEAAAYAAARQTRGTLAVPAWLQALHAAAAVGGVGLCGLLLAWRRDLAAGFAAAVLLALLANAAITGGLSAPHDRCQSRVIWLAPLVAALGLARATRGRALQWRAWSAAWPGPVPRDRASGTVLARAAQGATASDRGVPA